MTTAPWRAASSVDDACRDWPLLFSAGADAEGREWVVCTDHVHASEYAGDGPEGDAKGVAFLRNNGLALIARVRELEGLLGEAAEELEVHEWCDLDESWGAFCRVCGEADGGEHKGDCAWLGLVTRLRAALPSEDTPHAH